MKRAPLILGVAIAASAGCALVAGIDTFQTGFAVDAGLEAADPIDAAVADISVDAMVTVDAGDADAPLGVDARAVCPSVCAEAGVGSCDEAGTCTIDCTAAGTCPGPIVCPSGIPCAVTCTGADSCMSTIDCTGSSACTIKCVGAASCKQRVACSGKSCEVDCSRAFTCLGGVCCDAGSCTGMPPACQ